ncbi:hypothetical protein DPMN_087261 [Dreissena polymorpha]|uniref:Uncharacterized protein n=1 Tax=Dreissena polymorpha TaxID=45954 RepID=A0A9D4KTJ3_DREPO|nr:hypothetical protein DPMN_087261 [Dreissena polymorpha]
MSPALFSKRQKKHCRLSERCDVPPRWPGSGGSTCHLKKKHTNDDHFLPCGSGTLEVYMNLSNGIKTKDAIDILNNAMNSEVSEKVSTEVPIKPKGGELYLMDTDVLPNRKDAFYDIHFWRHDGTKQYTRTADQPKVFKPIYKIRDKSKNDQGISTAFQRLTYKLINSDRFMLI